MSELVVKIWTLSGEVPVYATDGASGFDLSAKISRSLTLAPGARAAIPTGICMALPRGYECQIRARSGLARVHGIGMVNGVGAIDADYRGEVHALLINLGNEPYTIRPGDRVAQGVIAPVTRVAFEAVIDIDNIGSTDRGAGGFGSTGR